MVPEKQPGRLGVLLNKIGEYFPYVIQMFLCEAMMGSDEESSFHDAVCDRKSAFHGAVRDVLESRLAENIAGKYRPRLNVVLFEKHGKLHP